jgi:hypothetical protein
MSFCRKKAALEVADFVTRGGRISVVAQSNI